MTVICWEWETLGETFGVIFHCHLLGYFRSEIVHHLVRSCETLNLYICSGIWGPTKHLSLKITNSLVIFRLRKPLETLTRLAGLGIWTRDLPNASLMRYHGATSLGNSCIVWLAEQRIRVFVDKAFRKVFQVKSDEIKGESYTALSYMRCFLHVT